jgi:hypothetical protein
MITKTISLLLAAIFIVTLVSAQTQLRIPRISQPAKISQTIGLSDVSISYHRPGVKGREIWGNVVKYDEVWRAGALLLVTMSQLMEKNSEPELIGLW